MPKGEIKEVHASSIKAGPIQIERLPVAAGTYKEGSALKFSNNRYGLGNDNIEAVAAADITLANPGVIPAYVTGSRLRAGTILGSNGNALTLTVALRRYMRQYGITVEE